MLFRLHFLLHCICYFYIINFLFSLLHFILCRMCVCHMFNKVLTYLLTYLLKMLIPNDTSSIQRDVVNSAMRYVASRAFWRVGIVITDVNCEWSQWSTWSRCSQQCDVRQRTRTRQCLTSPCTGDAEEIENCLRENCPGEWASRYHHYTYVQGWRHIFIPTSDTERSLKCEVHKNLNA